MVLGVMCAVLQGRGDSRLASEVLAVAAAGQARCCRRARRWRRAALSLSGPWRRQGRAQQVWEVVSLSGAEGLEGENLLGQ